MKYSIKQKNIPSEWQKERLGDVAFFKNGKGHEQNIVSNGEYIVVNSKFVASGGKVFKKSDKKLSPLYIGEVVMVMSDVPKGKAIAKCFLINKNNSYTLNQRICAISSDKLNSLFLLYLLNRNRYFLSFDDGVNQTNLRRDDVLSCPLIFPPLLEQNKIVKILETWDDYLEKITKKIKTKKNIKRGLIKYLLSGRHRLFGFRDKWHIFKIEDIAEIKKGQDLSKDKLAVDGKYKCMLYGEIYTKYDEVASNIVSRTNYNEGIKSVKNDVLIPASTTTTAMDLATATVVLEGNVLLGGDINIIRDKNDNFNGIFLSYYLTHIKKLALARLAQGITIVHLYGKDFKKLKIELPSVKEQTAIADIIITTDQGIKLLEKRKKIIEDQKKYLLNNLITGKIRIPEFSK